MAGIPPDSIPRRLQDPDIGIEALAEEAAETYLRNKTLARKQGIPQKETYQNRFLSRTGLGYSTNDLIGIGIICTLIALLGFGILGTICWGIYLQTGHGL